MKPSKIVIEVDPEGEIILLRDDAGAPLEYSVQISEKAPVQTENSTVPMKPTESKSESRERHFTVACDKLPEERKENVEMYLSDSNYVLSFPTSTDNRYSKYPNDCAWFFHAVAKPDKMGIRCNLNYATCTTIARITHMNEAFAFTDDYFKNKKNTLRETCKGDDTFGKSYPGLIHDEAHLVGLRRITCLLPNDILLKTFKTELLETFDATLHKDGDIHVLKTTKGQNEYYVLVHNLLPCWLSDQLRQIIDNNVLGQNYKEWANSREVLCAKVIAKKAQEKIVRRVVDYLGVAVCDEKDFCHTFTNVIHESFVPKHSKKKCVTFCSGCAFTDDWTQGCLVKLGKCWKKGILHISGPENGTDSFGTGWQNKMGNVLPGCLYTNKKTIDPLKEVDWDPQWGFRHLEYF